MANHVTSVFDHKNNVFNSYFIISLSLIITYKEPVHWLNCYVYYGIVSRPDLGVNKYGVFYW